MPSINWADIPICASRTDLNSCAISSRCTSSPTQRSFSIGCTPLVMTDNDFKTEPVPVTNEELIGILGHRQKDISAFGCTSQVFINYAMIDTAFIQNLVLGMTLRSSAVNAKGLPLLEINIPAGLLTLRSAGAGGSSTLNNDGLAVDDENGVLRTLVGKLTR